MQYMPIMYNLHYLLNWQQAEYHLFGYSFTIALFLYLTVIFTGTYPSTQVYATVIVVHCDTKSQKLNLNFLFSFFFK